MAPHSSTFVWKIPWTEEPGRLQSMGSLESDTTERVHFHFSLSCIGEGNGNPLQCSCLENPRDGEVWWAAVYGVSQSQTRLKRLSSSSSSSISQTCLTSWALAYNIPWNILSSASNIESLFRCPLLRLLTSSITWWLKWKKRKVFVLIMSHQGDLSDKKKKEDSIFREVETGCWGRDDVENCPKTLLSLWSEVKWNESHSVMSDSLWPHGLYSPWNSPD